MSRYIEIIFRSKLRIAALAIVVPIALSALDLYIWRSYQSTELIWVDDLSVFGQTAALAVGYNSYLTPAQNAALRFSNLIGNQSFNNALVEKLVADGAIQPSEGPALIASLSQLVITPGGMASASGGGGSSGAGFSPDHTVLVSYVCRKQDICLAVLNNVLTVYRSLYSTLKAEGAATAHRIYESQLTDAEATLAAALAALQKYDAAHPVKQGQSNLSDPVRTQLQHDFDNAQHAVDQLKLQLSQVDSATQLSNGVSSDMSVIDGPKIQPGLYGIKGFRSDNLKTDAIIWVSCLAAAVIYVVSVAFTDRTVRDPLQIKKRLAQPVVTIPVI